MAQPPFEAVHTALLTIKPEACQAAIKDCGIYVEADD